MTRLTRRLGLTFIALGLCTLWSGCQRESGQVQDAVGTSNLMLQARVDQLALATDYIFSDDRFDTGAFNEDVTKLLNQWIKSDPNTVAWERDPLVETWSAPIQAAARVDELDRLDFLPSDPQYLQQAAWAKALVTWLASEQRITDYRALFFPTIQGLDAEAQNRIRNSQRPLSELLQVRYPELSTDQADQLATTLQLFDWTVRNVQIEPLLEEPTEDEIQLFALSEGDPTVPASLGVPGPGYTLLPEQVLKFGRGDAWQRGRVFLLGLRQLNLDAGWLAVEPQGTGKVSPQPWVVAVLIGDELFLFDPALGLPLPADDYDGIATLRAVREQPSLLTQLDVADFELSGRNRAAIPYRVRPTDVDQLSWLLDVSPPALSKRMKLVESSLTGTRRLRLTSQPSEMAARLSAASQIDDVQLWRVPVEAFLYRKSFEQAVRFQNPRVTEEFLFREQIIDFPCPVKRKIQIRDEYDSGGAGEFENQEVVRYDSVRLHTARHRALTGRFDAATREEEEGAKRLLLTMRFSDGEIDLLDTDRRVRGYFGVEAAGPGDQDERASTLIKTLLREVRATAALWLGLAHYEIGDPSSALEWFDQVETFDTRETWLVSTRYNRGRAQESLWKYDDAIRTYQQSRSAQQQGDAIRARLLLRIQDAQQSDKPAESGASPADESLPEDE